MFSYKGYKGMKCRVLGHYVWSFSKSGRKTGSALTLVNALEIIDLAEEATL